MFHFLPIAVRYDGSAPAAAGTATRCTSARCTPTRAARCRITSPDPHVKPALRFNYLSTDQDRREWVEAIRVARQILAQPAFGRSTAASCRPGRRSRATSRSSTGWRATPRPRCTRRARAAMGTDELSVVDPRTMRVHGVDGPARRRRVGDAVRDERQHLRAGDDARREGRRPDPRQHAAATPSRSSSTVIKLHQPAPDRVAREIDAIAHPELLEDVAAVVLDGLLADHELPGRSLRSCALGDELDDLDLARGERVARQRSRRGSRGRGSRGSARRRPPGRGTARRASPPRQASTRSRSAALLST